MTSVYMHAFDLKFFLFLFIILKYKITMDTFKKEMSQCEYVLKKYAYILKKIFVNKGILITKTI